MRLKRTGTTKRPFYRLVVIDKERANKGAVVENLGTYHVQIEPPKCEFKTEKVLEWLKKGAVPTDSVKTLLKSVGVWKQFKG